MILNWIIKHIKIKWATSYLNIINYEWGLTSLWADAQLFACRLCSWFVYITDLYNRSNWYKTIIVMCCNIIQLATMYYSNTKSKYKYWINLCRHIYIYNIQRSNIVLYLHAMVMLYHSQLCKKRFFDHSVVNTYFKILHS